MTSDEQPSPHQASTELPSAPRGFWTRARDVAFPRRRSVPAQIAIALIGAVGVLLVWRYWTHDTWRQSFRGAVFFCVYIFFVLGILERRRRRRTPPS